MNRKIQYRAWDTEAEDWVRSSIIIYEHICEWGISDTTRCRSKEKWIAEQYTGLKDKNGVEIYEGDIVCFGNVKYPMVVVYEKTAFRLYCEEAGASGCPIGELELCEIIGNIHENPELLEGEK